MIVYLWHTVIEPLSTGATNIMNRLRGFVFRGKQKMEIIRTIELKRDQWMHLQVLLGADVKARNDLVSHALAHGEAYEDPGLAIAYRIMTKIDAGPESEIPSIEDLIRESKKNENNA